MRKVCRIVFVSGLLCAAAGAQEKADRIDKPTKPTLVAGTIPRAGYVLGPGDEITVWVRDLEEVNRKPIRIESDGFVSLPLIGRMKASGLTADQLEQALRERLKPQILDPEVAVGIAEAKSQPVSVIGAVNHPGVLQVQGNKSLVEVLSMAEGLRQDAGHTITVTRRLEFGKIPLSNATEDSTHQYSIAKIDFKDGLMAGENPQTNIAMKPYDVVSVPKADVIYVVGEVKKSGGFVLNERESLSVLQALSLAEGLNRTASPKGAKILRANAQGPRTEIPVDLQKLLGGKGEDLRLQPNDILFIPNSLSRSAALRGLQSAIEIGTGVAIWHR
jgi:polysaccharide export outer membrane protein